VSIQTKPPTELISANQLQNKVDELSQTIAQDINDNWMIVALLRGSFIFAADLVRALHQRGCNPLIDFMAVSSYGKGTEGKQVKISHDLKVDVRGRNILIVDDIYDSGKTLQAITQLLTKQGAKSIKTAVLLEKIGRDTVGLKVDYVGFKISNQFVVGYGLDHAGHYRTLPYIGVIS